MANRRIGAEDSATRARLLDATEKLMVQEGYAAVTTRRLSRKAGLKPQLVHYYFRTMDDLFHAMYKRVVQRTTERMERAMATGNPIRALWDFASDTVGTVLTIELRGLANHRKAFRKSMAQSLVLFRKVQIEHLTRFLEDRGLGSRAEALVIAVLVVSLSRYLVSEKVLGVSMGHAQTLEFVERCLLSEGKLIKPLFRKGSRSKRRIGVRKKKIT
jgi:AcrR family transcriptional regulator